MQQSNTPQTTDTLPREQRKLDTPVYVAAPFILAPPSVFARTHSGRDIPLIAPALDEFYPMADMPVLNKHRHSQKRAPQALFENLLEKPREYSAESFMQTQAPLCEAGGLPSFLKTIQTNASGESTTQEAHEMSLMTLVSKVSVKALAGIDYLGNFLASTFGVTTHRYVYQLDSAQEYMAEMELEENNADDFFSEKMMKRAGSSFLRDELHNNEWRMSNQC